MSDAKSNCACKLSAALALAAFASGVSGQVTSGVRSESKPRCTEEVRLSAGELHHMDSSAWVKSCYRLEVPPYSGFLIVATAPSEPVRSGRRPRFRAWTEAGPVSLGSAAVGGTAPVVVMGESASHLTLWIRGDVGAVVVEVAPADPLELGEHVLETRFLAETDLVAMAEVDSEARPRLKDSEDGEIDPILGPKSTSEVTAPRLPGSLRPGLYTLLVESRSDDHGPYSLIFSALPR